MRRLFGGLGARGASGEKPKKPIRANLGDESSFYYDEKLKSWVDRNDKSGAAEEEEATATPRASRRRPRPRRPRPRCPSCCPPPRRPPRTAATATGSTAPGSNPLSRSNSLSRAQQVR